VVLSLVIGPPIPWDARVLDHPLHIPPSSRARLSAPTMDHPFHAPPASRARMSAPTYGPPEALCRLPGRVFRTAPTLIARNLAARLTGNRARREASPEFWPESVCDALTINARSRETLPRPVQRLDIHRTAKLRHQLSAQAVGFFDRGKMP
jgi:hypothetical protein